MAMNRREEALRRLGGPVCPVCHSASGSIEVRYLTSDGCEWLKSRGKQAVEREQLAPMCANCFLIMTNEVVATKMSRAQKQAADDARAVQDRMRLTAMVAGAPEYREACEEYEDDLEAAMKISDEWGIGNGLFGSRGE